MVIRIDSRGFNLIQKFTHAFDGLLAPDADVSKASRAACAASAVGGVVLAAMGGVGVAAGGVGCLRGSVTGFGATAGSFCSNRCNRLHFSHCSIIIKFSCCAIQNSNGITREDT